jgi:hypothetical protein
MIVGRWIAAAIPIEWKAVDLKLERKDQGRVWVYSFNLELRNTQGQRVTFAEMEYVIYQPGSGSTSHAKRRASRQD